MKNDLRYNLGKPFCCNEVPRVQLRAKLDVPIVSTVSPAKNCATRHKTSTPKKSYSKDIPGEIFRVLKKKEIKQFWGVSDSTIGI